MFERLQIVFSKISANSVIFDLSVKSYYNSRVLTLAMDSHPDFASSYSAPAAKIDEDSNIANRNFATTYMEPTFPPVVALSDGQSVMVPQPQRDPTSGSQHATLPTDLPNMMSSALAQPNPSAFSFIPPAAPLQKSAMSNVNPLTLRQAYSMPPAGLVGPGRHYDPSLNSASTRGEYKMASDIFGEER